MNQITNEDLLETIEREDRAFRDHWLFRELQCTPEDLFEAVKEYSAQMGLETPKLNDIPRIAKEMPKPIPFKQMSASNRFILRA